MPGVDLKLGSLVEPQALAWGVKKLVLHDGNAWIVFVPLEKTRQSLEDSAFPGRAWEREQKAFARRSFPGSAWERIVFEALPLDEQKLRTHIYLAIPVF